MLTGAELTDMREEAELALPDVCVVQARTLTSDGQGGRTEAYATSVTTTCRVSPAGQTTQGNEVTRGDGTKALADWIVTLPYSTSVAQTDRLLVNGVTYEVLGVKAPRGWEITRRVLARTIA